MAIKFLPLPVTEANIVVVVFNAPCTVIDPLMFIDPVTECASVILLPIIIPVEVTTSSSGAPALTVNDPVILVEPVIRKLPDIIAEPVNGKVGDIEPVLTIIGNVVPSPLVNVIVFDVTDAVVILFNATDAVIALEELTANEALNTAIEPVCDTNK